MGKGTDGKVVVAIALARDISPKARVRKISAFEIGLEFLSSKTMIPDVIAPDRLCFDDCILLNNGFTARISVERIEAGMRIETPIAAIAIAPV